MINLESWGTAKVGSHRLQACGKLGVLFLNLELSARGLGVGNGIDDFAFCAGEFGGSCEVFECFSDLALLQEKLGHGSNGNITLRVNCNHWLVFLTH